MFHTTQAQIEESIMIQPNSNQGTINPHCSICSQPISGKSHPYNDIGLTDYGIFNHLRVYHCNYCGFGFSAPELSEKTVNLFYEKQYRAKNSTFYFNFNESIPEGLGDIRSDRSFAQIMLARAYCEFDAEDIFLDIGPGRGGSFKLAKALLQRPQLYGIEFSQGAKEFYLRNFGVVSHQSIDEFIKSGKQAKILLMSHSLEHYRLSELTNLFSALTPALAKNGVLVIEVPHVDLRIHSEVRGVDTPHFLFFSKQSLSLMLEKCGFDVLFIDTCGDEFKTVGEQAFSANSLSSKMKNYLKPFYNKLHPRHQNLFRTFVRMIQKTISFRFVSQNEMKVLPVHSYGGNRDCLRLVAKKK